MQLEAIVLDRVLATVIAALSGTSASAQESAQSEVTADEAAEIARDAYVFGYPLVTMEMTRRVMTNVAEPKGLRAPMGQLAIRREYPDANFVDVTTPDADLLYFTAWVEVTDEPWVLEVPDMHDRYYLIPMFDAWTNVFAAPGKRTTGTDAQTYVITGPGWDGELPNHVEHYESPTGLVWIVGGIHCTGKPLDYEVVHELQDQVSLLPLSAWGKDRSPPRGKVDPDIDMETPVSQQVDEMDGVTFFTMLADLMEANPPADADQEMVEQMARIGIVPGQPFEVDDLDPTVRKAIEAAPEAGWKELSAHFDSIGVNENGWTFATDTGEYGTNYLQRATIAAIGIGASLPEDAVYPISKTDKEGRPYDGANRYVMRIPKGQMPPVEAIWSLTMYDDKLFLYANEPDRYTLSQRDVFVQNPDGSVDLYIQHEDPGDAKRPNWLPAPKGRFVLMLRMFWPRRGSPSILDGSWTVPPVEKVAEPR